MARRKKTRYQLRRRLPYGICSVSVCPIRSRPDDKSEMVSQLLFGECVTILNSQKNWVKVQCDLDQYIGWMDVKQLDRISEEEFEQFRYTKLTCIDTISSISNHQHTFPILLGSSLPKFDGLHLQMPDFKYVFNGTVCDPEKVEPLELVERMARKFMHAPYLWGGRSVFGIDCSGFTQLVFKILGIGLPRDAKDQVAIGDNVEFVEQGQVGDLAFFMNDNNQVNHVGILLDNQQIIHASGQVRIDLLDHQGIFNRETKKYTHQIKIIKRILPTLTTEETIESDLLTKPE